MQGERRDKIDLCPAHEAAREDPLEVGRIISLEIVLAFDRNADGGVEGLAIVLIEKVVASRKLDGPAYDAGRAVNLHEGISRQAIAKAKRRK